MCALCWPLANRSDRGRGYFALHLNSISKEAGGDELVGETHTKNNNLGQAFEGILSSQVTYISQDHGTPGPVENSVGVSSCVPARISLRFGEEPQDEPCVARP